MEKLPEKLSHGAILALGDRSPSEYGVWHGIAALWQDFGAMIDCVAELQCEIVMFKEWRQDHTGVSEAFRGPSPGRISTSPGYWSCIEPHIGGSREGRLSEYHCAMSADPPSLGLVRECVAPGCPGRWVYVRKEKENE